MAYLYACSAVNGLSKDKKLSCAIGKMSLTCMATKAQLGVPILMYVCAAQHMFMP